MTVVNTEIGYHVTPNHLIPNHGPLAEGVAGAQFFSAGGNGFGVQYFGAIGNEGSLGSQFHYSNIAHSDCGGYPGYHTTAYHTTGNHASNRCASIAVQFTSRRENAVGAQFLAAIYNVTNLRVMCEFPSRGDGANWTANSTEPSSTSSFDVNNLNTDIVEQIWRTATAVKTGVVLEADAGAGKTIFVDTIGIINHNLTTSATVTFIESDNPGHAPTGRTTSLQMENDENFVYIAPDLPSSGFRYQRITIDDATNSNAFLSIGTIVYGPAIIFHEECFVDKVVKETKNFTDSVFTEAFTNVKNDRGLKRRVKLDFRNIRFNGANFEKLVDGVFEEARTILKCLWVPTPQFPLRFLTFAKMKQIPVETHNVKGENLDFIDFSIETDESL